VSSQKKKKNTDDSGNQMHPTVMHIKECSTQIQNAFETMLDFIIVSHFHYTPALEGAVNMRAVDLKRYARQRYIVYRGHHPLRSLQRLASCRHTYNPQNLCLIISSRARAKITAPLKRLL